MKNNRKTKHQVNRNAISDLWIASCYVPEKGKRLSLVDDKTWLEVSTKSSDRAVKENFVNKYCNQQRKIFKTRVL